MAEWVEERKRLCPFSSANNVAHQPSSPVSYEGSVKLWLQTQRRRQMSVWLKIWATLASITPGFSTQSIFISIPGSVAPIPRGLYTTYFLYVNLTLGLVQYLLSRWRKLDGWKTVNRWQACTLLAASCQRVHWSVEWTTNEISLGKYPASLKDPSRTLRRSLQQTKRCRYASRWNFFRPLLSVIP